MKTHTQNSLRVESDVHGKEIFLVADDGLTIAIVPRDDCENGDADAERLAKCWNLHDELVAACKLAEAYLADTDLDDEPEDGEYSDGKRAMMACRDVLAKIKGES